MAVERVCDYGSNIERVPKLILATSDNEPNELVLGAVKERSR